MHAFYAALGRFTVKFRWVIVVVWLLGSVAAVRGMPSLASQVNSQNTAFLPNNAPEVKAANLGQPLLGKTRAEPVLVVAVTPDRKLTSADEAAVRRETAALRQVHGISQVQFMGLAPSGKAILLSANSTLAGFDPAQAKKIVDATVSSFATAHPPPGLHFYVTGQVADGVYQNAQSRQSGNATQGLSILFIIILLFFIFRSVLAPIVTLLPSVFVLAVAGSVVGEIASHHVLKVSQITELLLIVLVLGAGTDYGLFLVYRVREGLRAGLDSREAVSLAVSRVGESITASAATVVLALLSLLFASFGVYHDLAVPLAIGVATMLLAGLTLLPALLAILGKAVFWPSRPKDQQKIGLWGRVAGRVVSKPVPTLLAGLGLFGLMAVGVMWYHPSGFAGAETAPAGTIAARGDAAVKHYFSGASANPTNLVVQLRESAFTDPGQIEKMRASLESSGQFTTVNDALSPEGSSITAAQLQSLRAELGPAQSLPQQPPANLKVPVSLYETYRADAQYISSNGRLVQFAVGLRAGGAGSTAALNDVPKLRAALAQAANSVHAEKWGVAGEAPALYDISSTSDGDLKLIVPIAALLIAVLLALVLRSLIAPLYLILSVVLSYLAALGISVIIFVKLGHSSGLVFILPFLMFIFLLALGEDYNILVMTRIREEAHDHPLREAVVRAVNASGPTITSAGLVLAGSFGVLAFAGSGGSGGGQVKNIGVGLALGILMDTFLVRTLLVPSTVALLGRWNWWPRHVEAGMGYPGTEQHHRWHLHRRRAAEAHVAATAEAGSPDQAGLRSTEATGHVPQPAHQGPTPPAAQPTPPAPATRPAAAPTTPGTQQAPPTQPTRINGFNGAGEQHKPTEARD